MCTEFTMLILHDGGANHTVMAYSVLTVFDFKHFRTFRIFDGFRVLKEFSNFCEPIWSQYGENSKL